MSYATKRPRSPPWSADRWIGPIPEAPDCAAEFCPAEFDDEVNSDDQAPPGPAPVWGGYRPVRALPRPWGEGDGEYLAHSSETRLLRVRRGDGVFEWWVLAPRRISQRAIGILLARLQDVGRPGYMPDPANWPNAEAFAEFSRRRKDAAAVASATVLYGVSDEEEAIAALRLTRRRGGAVYSERPVEPYDSDEHFDRPRRARYDDIEEEEGA